MSNNDTKKLNIKQVKECDGNNGDGCFMDSCGHNCGCFIKVDEPKQETLEEAAEEYLIKKYQKGTYLGKLFTAGAKWQAERMFSEEDMKKCWNAAYVDALAIDEETYKPLFFEDFIEQFKNKQ